jgi:hypothetical protein
VYEFRAYLRVRAEDGATAKAEAEGVCAAVSESGTLLEAESLELDESPPDVEEDE